MTRGENDVAVAAADRLSVDEIREVLALAADAGEADGVGSLSDHTRLHVKHADDPGSGELHLLVRDRGQVVGYAHLDLHAESGAADAELVVAPAARGRGVGAALLAAVLAHAGNRPVRLWAHGRLPAAARLAERGGFHIDRVLLRMARPLGGSAPPLAEPTWPEGVTVRRFEVGRDEDAWLRVNARAFADLPDQGGWTRADVEAREAEAWFDPAGFFLAERSGDLLGFHWTKVHGGEGGHAHRAVGEVYVVGVDPAAQGLGLGRSLTLLGLRHLQEQGLPEVMLYVDEANRSAVRLYESLGFSVAGADARYSNAPDMHPAMRPAE